MREFGKFYTSFWIGKTGKEIKNLGRDTQVIAMYLMTCPHSTMIGIYYLPVSLISHETGIPIEDTRKSLRCMQDIDFCTYDTESEYVWIHNMAHYQISPKLKPEDKRVKGVNDVFNKLPNLPFLSMFYEKYKKQFWLESPRFSEVTSMSHLSKEKKKEKDKEKENKKISMSGTLKSQAEEVLKFLNEKTGRVYRPVDTNLKLIMARLKSGATVMDCRQVIAKKTREWRSDAKMSEYLRPATLFNAIKFEQYVGELVVVEE